MTRVIKHLNFKLKFYRGSESLKNVCLVTCKEFTVFTYDKFNLNNNILTQKSSDTWYVVCYHSYNRSKQSRFPLS